MVLYLNDGYHEAMSANFLLQMLKENGYSLTRPRRAICDLLVSDGGHVTADQLVERLQDRHPDIGRMTVYRTLELLSSLGGLRPVYQGSGAAHYILLKGGHHHHLVCAACHQVIEIDQCLLQDTSEQIRQLYQFEIIGHLLEIFGICRACREQSS